MNEFFSYVASAAGYIIPFFIVLGVVVFVHEFGHFWIARLCGVKIESFSIGFGREIVGWNDKHGTRWKLAWMPLGGYVKMYGDSDPSSALPGEEVKAMTEEEKKVAFYFQKTWKRFAIVAAGPGFNYLFAIVVLAGLFAFNGQPYTVPLVSEVQADTAAAEAGIKAGDRILVVDGQKIESFEDIKRIVAMNAGTPVDIELEREGKTETLRATPRVVRTTDRLGGEHMLGRLGILSTKLEFRDLSPLSALGESAVETWNITAGTLKGVWQMIIGQRGADELGGPLKIAEMSGNIAKEGLASFVWFLVVISINLGLVNLFPIPLLDGGHLLFYAIEGVRGRPLNERAQEIGTRIGAGVVAFLFLFATWNDLVSLRVVAYIHGLFS